MATTAAPHVGARPGIPAPALSPHPIERRGLGAWLTTPDHKKIGIMYLVTTFIFFPDPSGRYATGAADAGWTSYPPLSVRGPYGQSLWLVGLIILGTSSILGSMNFMVTILNMRTPGMTMHRIPLFVWAMLTTSF